MGKIGKLNLCLTRLGGFQLATFVDRKLLQKKVYFLQEFGVDFGYYFGFYLYGPYSSELTNDAFFLSALIAQAPETLETTQLSPQEEEAMRIAKEFFDEIDGEIPEIADKLELLASLHFLWSKSYFQDKTKDAIFRKLNERKPMFSYEDLENAWAYLIDHHLIVY